MKYVVWFESADDGVRLYVCLDRWLRADCQALIDPDCLIDTEADAKLVKALAKHAFGSAVFHIAPVDGYHF
jgi:hypothetical protein